MFVVKKNVRSTGKWRGGIYHGDVERARRQKASSSQRLPPHPPHPPASSCSCPFPPPAHNQMWRRGLRPPPLIVEARIPPTWAPAPPPDLLLRLHATPRHYATRASTYCLASPTPPPLPLCFASRWVPAASLPNQPKPPSLLVHAAFLFSRARSSSLGDGAPRWLSCYLQVRIINMLENWGVGWGIP
jgi:hypothetical protein